MLPCTLFCLPADPEFRGREQLERVVRYLGSGSKRPKSERECMDDFHQSDSLPPTQCADSLVLPASAGRRQTQLREGSQREHPLHLAQRHIGGMPLQLHGVRARGVRDPG